MPNKISVANLVMLAGAVVTLLFSFFDFFDRGGNAWDTAILALVMGVWIVLELVGVSLPEQLLTFDRPQLKATWGIAAAGIMLSWITTDADKGVGYWLMFIGSIAMAVGAVMALLGKGTETVDIPGGGSGSTKEAHPVTESTTPPPPPAT